MRSLSLKSRISLSLLVALLILAGAISAFARTSFRDLETTNAERELMTRTDGVAQIADARFVALGEAAVRAARDLGQENDLDVLDELLRAGFDTALVLGERDAPRNASGDAEDNMSLRALMLVSAPPSGSSAIRYEYYNGWLVIAARSPQQASAVVGAISSASLSRGFLLDALLHSEYEFGLVTSSGEVIASSDKFAADEIAIATQSAYRPFGLDAYFEGRAPDATVDARVDAMTARFLLAIAVAFGSAGAVTILLVAYSFRPLDKITEAARRLGRGDEDLQLDVRNRDELGELAQVLKGSAQKIADARRAQQAAAEDFELAVGAISRAVGEADTAHEVAARLSDAILRVTQTPAVMVKRGAELLAKAGRDMEAPPSGEWTQLRSRGGDLDVWLLAPVSMAEIRKADLLLAQATVAMHRALSADALRQAKAQKETFLDILSHDLKNPIAVARGRVELLERKHPESVDKLQMVTASLDRATRIIEEAVLLSKLERNDALEKSDLDLGALVEEAAASLRPLAQPRGISVVVDAPPNAQWPANRLLARAIENLISNAVKWSKDGGEVAVRVVPDDHVCLLMIVDHGPGIPDEDKKRLFARFERADRTGVKGTGLGLAIALRVTQMHGGTIRIEDTPGGGATFVLELPDPTPRIAPEAIA